MWVSRGPYRQGVNGVVFKLKWHICHYDEYNMIIISVLRILSQAQGVKTFKRGVSEKFVYFYVDYFSLYLF